MRTATAPAARPRQAASPARALRVAPGPRRVSGPARGGRGSGTPRGRTGREIGIAYGLLSTLERLPRRLPLGGRTWIALVAFALIGIVTLQLGLLKLNAGIGRAIEHEALLQRENAALSIEDSELGASAHVTSRATRLGMQFAPAGALRFLEAHSAIGAGVLGAAVSAMAHGPSAASSSAQGASWSGSTESQAGSTATAPSGESSGPGSAGAGGAAERPAGSSESPPAASAGEESNAGSGASESAQLQAVPQRAREQAGGGSSGGAPGGGTQASSSG